MTVKDLKEALSKYPDGLSVGVVENDTTRLGNNWVNCFNVELFSVMIDKFGHPVKTVNESCKEVVILR